MGSEYLTLSNGESDLSLDELTKKLSVLSEQGYGSFKVINSYCINSDFEIEIAKNTPHGPFINFQQN